MSCRSVRGWLHRDVSSLDETQRLQLDDHLASCELCRGDRHRMRLVNEIGTALPVPPAGAREYNRAIARALLEGNASRNAPPRRPRWLVPIGLATAGALTIAIVLIALSGDRESSPVIARPPAPTPVPRDVVPPPPAPAPAPSDVIESGELVGTTTLTRGAQVPAHVPLRAKESSTVRLASLRVVIAASSQIRWAPVERELLLERGAAEIEAGAPGRARVVTNRFEVEIDGDAALTVEMGTVRVRRGTARVLDRSHVQLAQLGAGATWEAKKHKPRGDARPAGKSAADLLAEARALFAAKDYAGAERAAEGVLASAHGVAEEAEATTLLGDVAQASGRLDDAVTRYATVAARFADLPAAESALYAAARIELRRARNTEARALLTLYLDRYPAGRYAGDVRDKLGTLSPGSP